MNCKVTVTENKPVKVLMTKEEREALSKAINILDKYDKTGIGDLITEFLFDTDEE